MYIEPNSKIILCNNVPLDNTYQHTIFFASASAQSSYFLSKAKVTLNDQSYQRVVKGKMRVQCSADSIYDCNYLMFQNSSYGTKWFYAFVTGVEFVNNVTSEVSFEIDSLQTYFFDTVVMPCYVEREHSATDEVGDNLVAENLGNPELCVMNVWTRYWSNDSSNPNMRWKCAIQIIPSLLGTAIEVGDPFYYSHNQIYPNTKEIDVSALELTNLNAWIRAADAVATICGGYYFPAEFGDTIAPIPITNLNTYGITRPSSYIDYGSAGALPTEYAPKNKKLFTYPYTKLVVASTSGSTAEYKWEDTREGFVKFNLHHNHLNVAACELRPTNYYRNPASRMNTVAIEEFPQVKISDNPNLSFSNICGALSNFAFDAGNAESGEELSIGGITQLIASKPSGKTSVSNGNLDLKYNSFGFVFYQMGIRA